MLVTAGYGLSFFIPPVVPPSAGAPRPTLRPARVDPRREEDDLIAIVTAALHIIYSQ